MSEQKKELWRELCEQAAAEQDPQKLHALVREIIGLLEAKAQPFEQLRSNIASTTQTDGQLDSTQR